MTIVQKDFETRCISSLEKVFPDEELQQAPFHKASALINEIFSFQVAYRANRIIKDIRVSVQPEESNYVTIRTVGLVPSELPVYPDHDENVIRTTPGLYPDPLYPISNEGVIAFPNQWRSVWVTVNTEGMSPGLHSLKIRFESNAGDCLGEEHFELDSIPAVLPEQKLIHTEWFHTDCIATYYNTDVFSERHWQLIEMFVGTAVKHGMNMILTPLFTPPLDTEVGKERPTVQLIDVEVTADQAYVFGFEKLERWVQLCNSQGVKYLEFSHLFTQWGAKHAPKIMATVEGEYKRIFGWETDASGDEYRLFLEQFLPELVKWIKNNHLEDRVYFHVSDEPSIDSIESYGSASRILMQYLSEFPIIDALSDYDFYSKGLVKNPIPGNDHIQHFLDHGVQSLWTYYCCVQYKQVANRFFSMPSARNRILGVQLYQHDIVGFLHWGYNFWYAQYSRKPINPFLNTDANYAFASGDAFLVYPGEEGPIESIRLEVVREAFQDVRALELLENYYGKAYVKEELEKQAIKPITFTDYPKETEWILSMREWVNQKIKEKL